MKYKIKTGRQSWKVEAKSKNEAIRKAWNERPPKVIGQLVEIIEGGGGDDLTFYMSGSRAALNAGLNVEVDNG